jgi:hypothetical protein
MAVTVLLVLVAAAVEMVTHHRHFQHGPCPCRQGGGLPSTTLLNGS